MACTDIEHYSLGEPAPSPLPDFELDAGAAQIQEALKYCLLDAGVTLDASASFYGLSPASLLSCANLPMGPIDPLCPVSSVVACALRRSGIADKYHIPLPP